MLDELRAAGSEHRKPRTSDYFRALGYSDYRAIDINDLYGSLVMDLNRRVRDAYGYDETYELVTNNGTGEHIFNQMAIFENVHDLTAPDGWMLHVMPFVGYHNHGLYAFQPNLYYALARANGYELVLAGVATRGGRGFVCSADETDSLPPLLIEDRRLPMRVLLSGAKLPKTGLVGALVHALKPRDDGRRLGAELKRLTRERANLLTFALLRKHGQGEFRIPIQTRYIDDLGTDELRKEYTDND